MYCNKMRSCKNWLWCHQPGGQSLNYTTMNITNLGFVFSKVSYKNMSFHSRVLPSALHTCKTRRKTKHLFSSASTYYNNMACEGFLRFLNRTALPLRKYFDKQGCTPSYPSFNSQHTSFTKTQNNVCKHQQSSSSSINDHHASSTC